MRPYLGLLVLEALLVLGLVYLSVQPLLHVAKSLAG